jgi:hypothetical protein
MEGPTITLASRGSTLKKKLSPRLITIGSPEVPLVSLDEIPP